MRPTTSTAAIKQDWATHVKAAAAAIYGANPNLLVMIGGISYDLDLSWLYSTPLDRSSFANRTVWEAHWCTLCGTGTIAAAHDLLRLVVVQQHVVQLARDLPRQQRRLPPRF
jgi:hypothetical protein